MCSSSVHVRVLMRLSVRPKQGASPIRLVNIHEKRDIFLACIKKEPAPVRVHAVPPSCGMTYTHVDRQVGRH